MDFVVDAGGQLEFLEAEWTELPTENDAVNLDFARKVMRESPVVNGAVVSRTPHSFQLTIGFRALPVSELI